MKKLTFAIFAILIFSPALCQKIRGFGKITIGTTIEVLKDLGYPEKVFPISKQKEYYDYVHKKYTGNNIIEICPDRSDYGSRASLDDRVRVFYIPKLEVVKDVVAKGITLHFFQDSLYSINVDNPKELSDAFELKYGKPKVELNEEEKHYTNGYGNTITKIDQTFTSRWNTGYDNISCFSILSVYHDSEGKPNYINFMLIYDKNISSMVDSSDRKIREKLKNEERQKKLQSLDGL